MKFHALADLFPLLDGADFQALCADVKANGLRHKVVLLGTEILDGRNRWRACRATGTPCDFEVFRGKDPLAFVLSANLARRHLNESQRAMVAAKLANLGPGRPRRAENPANSQGFHVSRERAADLLRVSARSVASAADVLKLATPEIRGAAEHGLLAVSAAAVAARLPGDAQLEIFERAREGDARGVSVVLGKRRRAQREQELGARQSGLPRGVWGLVYADPEWQEDAWSRETGLNRAPENHYPTSPIAEICARDVRSISADDSVLALWTKSNAPHLGLRVMEAWGFEYRAQVVWRKDSMGMGRWFRNYHEVLMIGVRGDVPAPAPGTQWDSVIDAPVGAHSAKPEIFAEMLEAYFPSLRKIELNRRGPPRAGWDAWGNEAEEAA